MKELRQDVGGSIFGHLLFVSRNWNFLARASRILFAVEFSSVLYCRTIRIYGTKSTCRISNYQHYR